MVSSTEQNEQASRFVTSHASNGRRTRTRGQICARRSGSVDQRSWWRGLFRQNGAGGLGGKLLKRPNNYIVADAVVWGLTYLIITGRVMLEAPPFPIQMAGRRLILAVFGFGACLLLGRLLARLTTSPVWVRLLASVGLSVAGGLVYAVLNFVIFNVIWPLWEAPPLTLLSAVAMGSHFFWTFLSWCALYFAIRYEEESKAKDLRLVSAQALALDAQNRMLRYQINPHFLFNTLNALSALILARENGRAERVLLALSQFLRHTLERELPDKSPLAFEIDAQRQYLVIEQARFEARLRFVERVPAELNDALAPSLILQPLIENAVKYGVARSLEPVTIEIEAVALAGRLRLTVRDDGGAGEDLQPPKLGLGLENVRKRLELLYGDKASLTYGPRAPQGFEVSVELPLERA